VCQVHCTIKENRQSIPNQPFIVASKGYAFDDSPLLFQTVKLFLAVVRMASTFPSSIGKLDKVFSCWSEGEILNLYAKNTQVTS
jgi:hypothetical protein